MSIDKRFRRFLDEMDFFPYTFTSLAVTETVPIAGFHMTSLKFKLQNY